MLKFSSKFKRIIAAILTVSILFVGSFITASTAVASDNKVNTTSQKVTDTRQAIILIEQNFLGVNKDGTSYIKADAAMYIDPKVLDGIKKGMNAVNEDILSGVLVRDKNTNAITSVKGDTVTTSAKGNIITPASTLEGYYNWYWYGFDFVVDAYNAGLAAIDLTTARDNLAAGATVLGILGQVEVAVGAGVGVLIINGWINAAQTGHYTGRGAILSFLGTPSHCVLTGVYAR